MRYLAAAAPGTCASLSLRLKDLLGPVTRVKKKKDLHERRGAAGRGALDAPPLLRVQEEGEGSGGGEVLPPLPDATPAQAPGVTCLIHEEACG